MESRRGRPKKHELVVSPGQRAELERIARHSRSARSVAFRARIVLECAGGASNAAVAAKLRTTGFTVGLWRNRFIAEGVAGLGDEPRPGAPREIGDEKIEQVVRLTLKNTPKEATHWSAHASSQNRSKPVHHQPHLACLWTEAASQESFQLSTDPLLIDKVRDIVGLYLDPPIMRCCCAWMRSRRSRHSAIPAVLPMRAGQRERRTRLEGHGVTSLFAALDIATGNVFGKCYRRHRSVEFLDFLKKIDTAVPADLDIHLVLDNYGTHKTALVRQWLQKRSRYHLHFTPTHAPGSTKWNAGSHCLHNGRSSAVHTPACRNRNGDPRIHRCPQPTAQTLSMDQVRRPDPGLIARFATSTLAAHSPTTYTRNQ